MLLSIAGIRPEPAVSVPSAVDRIFGNAVGRAHTDETGRELVEIGLADDDGARRAQPRHRCRVLRRRVGEARAGCGGRQALDIDIVLHRDGHAVQRQHRGIVVRGERLGLGERVQFVAQGDEDGGIVMRADALVAACHRVHGRVPAHAVGGDDLSGGLGHTELRSGKRFAMRGGLSGYFLGPSKQAVCHCVQYRRALHDRNRASVSVV
jgi:hypothetical protein